MLQQKFRVSAKGSTEERLLLLGEKQFRNSFMKIIAPLREFWGGQGCTPDRGTHKGGGDKGKNCRQQGFQSERERLPEKGRPKH